MLRIGKWRPSRLFLFAAVPILPACAWSQIVVCTSNTSATNVHAEGLAETVGSVILNCSGGIAGGTATLTPFIALNTNITNRLDQNGNPTNISVVVTGAPTVSPGTVTLSGAQTLLISDLSYTIPTPSSVGVTITITGIHAAVASLNNGVGNSAVNATINGIGFSYQGTPTLTLSLSQTSLLASTLNNALSVCGVTVASPVDYAGLLSSGTLASTVRITEGYASAFLSKMGTDDTGVRIIVPLSGYASGVQLWAPDAIAGNSASVPTSAGAFQTSPAGGTYTPGAGQLLLIRINGADATGAGGTFALTQPVTTTVLDSMTEVDQAGYVVYEVVDDNPNVVESAMIPIFPVLTAGACAVSPSATLEGQLAPVSNVAIATMTDPIPRFINITPGSDCQTFNGCSAGYYPMLSLNQTSIALTGASLGVPQTTSLAVTNTGGAQFGFQVTTAYQSGSGWLTVTPLSGVNSASLAVSANPASLQPGTFNATITVSAGTAGQVTVPVTFTVGPPGVTIQGIVNAASFQTGAISSGSYVAIFGVNLAGTNVGVTFNGLAGTVTYDSAGQINVIVPNLGVQNGAGVVATVGGNTSSQFNVVLKPNVPGIFTPGIVNPNGTVNGASNPATRGGTVAIYMTGLSIPLTGAVTVNMGTTAAGTGLTPSFVGPQGTYPALDQVNVAVPAGLALTGNSVPVSVCVVDSTGNVCSNQVSLYLQ